MLRLLALISVEAGDHREAGVLLDEAGAPDFPVVEPGTRGTVLETQLRAALTTGDVTAAAAAAAQERHAERSGLAADVARAARARSRLLLARDRADEAAANAAASWAAAAAAAGAPTGGGPRPGDRG